MSDRSGPYKFSRKSERRDAALYVRSTGREQCGAGAGWGPGVRDHYLVHHVLAGRGVYIAGGQRHDLAAGDTFLAYPGATIHYFADSVEPWEYIWVGFAGVDAGALLALTAFTPARPVLHENGAEVSGLLEQIYRDYGAAVWQNLRMTAHLYDLLSCLVRAAGERERPAASDCAQLAADYMVTHYEKPLTVEAVARELSVSYSSLYRSFMKRFGCSPKRFLLEYRIERARLLLETGRHSVHEVSNSVGFEDPFYFSRAFKEVVGESPRRYMAARKNTEETPCD